MAAKKDLSPKAALFVNEFLRDLNGTQAAIRAGYSAKTAATQASRLLKNVQVQRAIAAARERIATKFEITRERVMLEYARLAFSDPRNFFNDDGTMKRVPELDDDAAAALAGFEVMEEFEGSGKDRFQIGVTSKVKWADKKGALDSISKIMGWSVERVKSEVSGVDGAPIETKTTVDLSNLTIEQLRVLASIKI
ncbi:MULTISPECIES: terminase small subunit [unclassified Burkholderia]|uniref:terminase small subunit n=1 Tax=unclassified Burkholderia TaxID=2613784 RepID=UPI000F58DC58|nr:MULTISPECIES: terminase small subunit [unclassified Burkholderia]RQR87643.1 terminase small subunit [Burkholderia sp. Bp9011]RQR96990.1 terminase small subunit [Burkholderia sp. Bp9010]RQS80696.1 terminase small subunit [Burkholderia sp. Bp8977]